MKKILLLLLLPIITEAQTITNPLLTPVGAVKSFSPNITLTNTVTAETSLLGAVKDTIRANTLIPYRPYRFEMACIVTTPAISLPSLALKIYFGGQVVAMVNSTSVLGGLTNAGIRIRGIILSTSMTSQIVLTEIIQPNGGVITISNSNAAFYTALTVNTASNQVLDITAQWGGLSGTATIKSVWFYRPDF